MFLHGGLLHIGGNMLFLWVFGDNVEDVMGHARYLAFYLLTGIAAGLTQVVANPDSTVATIGASGAISGLLAAYLVCFPKGRILTGVFIGFIITTVMLPAWMMIGYWIVLQVISGLVSLGPAGAADSGVAWFAHIGGFVAGLILVFPFRRRDRVEFQRETRSRPDTRARRARLQQG
jgi:membrane associated rhomboid family serine protease